MLGHVGLGGQDNLANLLDWDGSQAQIIALKHLVGPVT
jgi:hypothetical protein